VRIVADEEIPLHGIVFRSERVKCGYSIVVWQSIHIRLDGVSTGKLQWVPSRFEHHHFFSGFRQPRRHCPTTRAGTDNCVFTFKIGLLQVTDRIAEAYGAVTVWWVRTWGRPYAIFREF